MANSYQLQAGEVGKVLSFPQTDGPNFTGATVTLLVKYPKGNAQSFLCDASSGTPIRITDGTEFTTAATNVELQLIYQNDGRQYKSKELKIDVLPNLE